MVIPTNVEVQREDLNDLISLRKEKFEAIIKDIKSIVDKGAPVWWVQHRLSIRTIIRHVKNDQNRT